MSFLNYFIRIIQALKQMNTIFFRSIKSISVLNYQLKFSKVIGDVITFTCVELFLFESVSERRTNFIFTCVLLHVLYKIDPAKLKELSELILIKSIQILSSHIYN